MCANREWVVACKAIATALLFISIVVHFTYELRRLTQLRTRSGSHSAAWRNFLSWMLFAAAILGTWIYLLCGAWPSSEWPPLLFKCMANLVWTTAIWLDEVETRRARIPRRMRGTGARATATSATAAPATSGPTPSGPRPSAPATSGSAVELDNLGQIGKTMESQGSDVDVDPGEIV
jgi:hypothetical protein